MRLFAVFPPHLNVEGIAAFVGAMLGEEWTVDAANDPGDLPDALSDTDVILDALVPLTADHIGKAISLKLIQTPSHGFDHVDLDAAAARGIPVCNVGTSGAEAANVAEHAFLLMLACAKRLVDGHNALATGRWAQQEMLGAGLTELRGKTLGVIGLGQIGRETAKRGQAFDMNVIYYDVVEGPPELEKAELDDLLARCDFVSIHVPLLPQTRGLIGAAQLAKLRAGAILVNTSRGPVVDAAALAEACRAGRIMAGIDVFDPEPPPADHPLVGCPNVVLSPHVAGVTGESVQRIMFEALENVKRFAAGEPLRDVVNGLEGGNRGAEPPDPNGV